MRRQGVERGRTINTISLLRECDILDVYIERQYYHLMVRVEQLSVSPTQCLASLP